MAGALGSDLEAEAGEPTGAALEADPGAAARSMPCRSRRRSAPSFARSASISSTPGVGSLLLFRIAVAVFVREEPSGREVGP